MNKSLNIFLWILFFALMAPSGMALASWNAVPGDATYSWKTNLESVLLAVLPSDKLKSATNSKLTERRMGEVSKVLSGTHASEGLNNLSAQVLTTKESLRKINNAEDRAVAVALYIQTLNEVNSQLETEKQSRAVAYLPPQQADTSQFSIKNLRRPAPVTTNNNTTNYNNTNTNQTVTTSPTNNYSPPSTIQPTQRPIGQTTQPVTTQPTQTTQPASTTQPVITQPTQQPTQQPGITQPTSPLEPTEEEIINEGVSEEIGQTQEEINEVIDELEDIIAEAEQESASGASAQQPGQAESQQQQQQQQREVREEERQQEQSQRETQQRQENQNNGRGQSERTEQESSENEESED